jgi:transposase
MPPAEEVYAENTSLKQELSATKTDLALAEMKIRDLQHRLYGRKSERQISEPEEAEQAVLPLAVPEAVTEQVPQEDPVKTVSRPRAPRQPLPEQLERVEMKLEAPEKTCPSCGRERKVIGEEVTEELDLIPARFVVRRIVRPKLACACGCSGVVIAPLPPRPIEKGNASAGLLAHIVTAKYIDHLPLARQSEIFRQRYGVVLPRQRLCDWVEAVATWLQPIHREMAQELLAGDIVQADETPVKILDPDHPANIRQGYLWTYSRPGGDVIFVCHTGRGQEHPAADLADFTGWLQSDAYRVYPALANKRPPERPLRLQGCWAHVRRKLIEAQESRPREARLGLELIRALYDIERASHGQDPPFTPDEIAAARQKHAPPIIAELKTLYERWRDGEPPTSLLFIAARYALNQWAALQVYLGDGRLAIDNNNVEAAIRRPAMGRRNWLFLGHPNAAWRSAVIYSIVGSCRRRGIEPSAYLADVLRRLPAMKADQVKDLVPARWKPAPS